MSDALLIGGAMFVAALLQSALFSSMEVLGGTPDLLLVLLLGIALLRGSLTGAVAGFFGGFVLDVATMGTLGVTALLLTLAGYWAGRYGETTGRDRFHAPILSVLVLTVLTTAAGYALYFMLGEDLSARHALIDSLLPTLGLNLLVAAPVFALCRTLLMRGEGGAVTPEVRLLG